MKKKIVVGITQGDGNGIGYEIIIKALSNSNILEICTPIVFGSLKLMTFYKKRMGRYDSLSFNLIVDAKEANPQKLNFINCIPEEFIAEPGKESRDGAKGAIYSLERGVEELKNNGIDLLVTAPFNKGAINREGFSFAGHTEYLTQQFGSGGSLMMMVSEDIKIAMATNHIPLEQVAKRVDKELLYQKLSLLFHSLREDFAIDRPKVALLALNPHAGENGLLGNEEEEILVPVVREFFERGELLFGPFAADGFFAHSSYINYDAVMALYHDQALIPFKILSRERGVNFTAGLPIVRCSPDHGTAFDLAGKGEASHHSMLAAIFTACDIFEKREEYRQLKSNPIKGDAIE
ncbi:MAG: 4-hydroxythreonine-4-phosphate dehydrogenase PdxA [Bacteroidales bacterium]